MEGVRLAHYCFALAPNTLRRAVSYLFLSRLVNLVDYRMSMFAPKEPSPASKYTLRPSVGYHILDFAGCNVND